jgi:hypothetical protein
MIIEFVFRSPATLFEGGEGYSREEGKAREERPQHNTHTPNPKTRMLPQKKRILTYI